MSKFKKADPIVRVLSSVNCMEVGTYCIVDSVLSNGALVIEGKSGSYVPNNFKAFTTKYPNPPRKWMHERIEFAKGAGIQFKCKINGYWREVTEPAFDSPNDYDFRVAPTRTELRIAQIQAKIDSRQIQIDKFRVRIDELKSGVGVL